MRKLLFPFQRLRIRCLRQRSTFTIKELLMKKFAVMVSALTGMALIISSVWAGSGDPRLALDSRPAPDRKSAQGEGKPVRVLFVLGSPPFHDIRTLPHFGEGTRPSRRLPSDALGASSG